MAKVAREPRPRPPAKEDAPKPSHRYLCELAGRWLYGQGCVVAMVEPRSQRHTEHPDAIGWNPSQHSIVIEVKVSREDFLIDAKKRHRHNGQGMGVTRYYLTPAKLLTPAEIPDPWGLLELRGDRIFTVKKPVDGTNPVMLPTDPRARSELALLLGQFERVLRGDEIALIQRPSEREAASYGPRSSVVGILRRAVARLTAWPSSTLELALVFGADEVGADALLLHEARSLFARRPRDLASCGDQARDAILRHSYALRQEHWERERLASNERWKQREAEMQARDEAHQRAIVRALEQYDATYGVSRDDAPSDPQA